MHKLTFSERRSGSDRRQGRRRSLKREALDLCNFTARRRRHERRSIYIRRETYTVYVADRL